MGIIWWFDLVRCSFAVRFGKEDGLFLATRWWICRHKESSRFPGQIYGSILLRLMGYCQRYMSELSWNIK